MVLTKEEARQGLVLFGINNQPATSPLIVQLWPEEFKPEELASGRWCSLGCPLKKKRRRWESLYRVVNCLQKRINYLKKDKGFEAWFHTKKGE